MAEREQSNRVSTANPFGLSHQLRDDLTGIIELMPAFVGIFTPEGRVAFINATGCKMLGLDPAGVTELHVRDLHPDIFSARFMTEAMSAADVSGNWSGDTCLRHRDGREIPVAGTVLAHRSPGGRARYYSLIARDVTDRNLAMNLLREQSALLENAQESIIEVDLDGRILLWNHGAKLLHGWSVQEATGRKIADLTYKEARDFEEARRVTLESGQWAGEVACLTRSGAQLEVESRWSLLRDDPGRPKAFLIISVDITEKKRHAAQFLRAQRMESIGRLAGGIAHDLNNVLAPILMGVGVLRLRNTDETSHKLLDTFELAAQRGAAMVRQVLAFSRGLEGRRVPVAPARLVQEIENLLHETMPKSIQVETRSEKDCWPVLGDVTQLHQVLLNLCINARDAMPHGGRLTIETRNVVVSEADRELNPEAGTGSHVLVQVTDTGVGIPAAIREKIFEPFFTTKEEGQGTGLGLSTVHSIVKSHGGFIQLESEEGKGTVFKIHLPAEPTATIQATPAGDGPLPQGRNELVLIIDDEEIVRDAAKAVLERAGYRALTARDGAEGLALYVQHLEAISLVLTDITMPVLDGIGTMRAIKRIRPYARIICASGQTSDRQLSVLADAGMSHFIPKPFTAEALVQTVHNALEKAGSPPA